jgi:hypothetical protein
MAATRRATKPGIGAQGRDTLPEQHKARSTTPPPVTCPSPSPPATEATTDTRRRILSDSPPKEAPRSTGRRAITVEHDRDSARPKAQQSSPPSRKDSMPVRRPSIRVDQVGARAGSYAISARHAPRLAKGKKDLASAPIDPKAAFLLSQIDGTMTVDDLADLTGMAREDVVAICERMARLGLLLL